MPTPAQPTDPIARLLALLEIASRTEGTERRDALRAVGGDGAEEFLEEKKDKGGRRYCMEHGKGRVPCPPKEGAKKPRARAAAKPAAARPAKQTAQQVHDHIKGLLASPEALTPDHIGRVVGLVAALTGAEQTKLKTALGIKASGKNKSELARKITERALAQKPAATAKKEPEKAGPQAPPEPAATIAYSGDSAAIATQLLGWPPSNADLAALGGGLPGVAVRASGKAMFGSVTMLASTPEFQATTYLRRGKDGRTELHLENIEVVKGQQGKGLGTRLLAAQLGAARRLGVGRATMLAAGPDDDDGPKNGHYTWARLGFDGPLAPKVAAKLPPALKGAKTVQDLMKTEAGRQWWKTNGVTTEMSLDLSPGSPGLAILNDYLRAKKLPPI